MIRIAARLRLLLLALIPASLLLMAPSCEEINKLLPTGLSDTEIVQALRAALDTGARVSTESASVVNKGFFLNPDIKIPVPKDIQNLMNDVAQLRDQPLLKGAIDYLESNTETLCKRINEAAERGSKVAFPIFAKAITDMTISDGLNILQGGKTAATDYLRNATFDSLVNAFAPKVDSVVRGAKLAQYWEPVVEKYNLILTTAKNPLIAPILKTKNIDLSNYNQINYSLPEYTTRLAMEGLFKLVAKEETAIRENPKGYASNLIQKVFGSPEAGIVRNK